MDIYLSTRANPLASPRLSALARLMVVVSAGLAVVMIGVRTVSQIILPTNDPFFAYREFFPGKSADVLEGGAFLCRLDYDREHSPVLTYCTYLPPAGDFSRVGLVISSGIIRQIDFEIRENTLRIGDIQRLLESRPRHTIYHIAHFSLPDQFVAAMVVGPLKHFSLFCPVSNIAFSDINLLPHR